MIYLDEVIIEGFKDPAGKRMVYISGHLPALEALEAHLPACVDMNSPTKLTLVLGVGARDLQGEWDVVFIDDWVLSEGLLEMNGGPLIKRPDARVFHVNHMDGSVIEYLEAERIRFVELPRE